MHGILSNCIHLSYRRTNQCCENVQKRSSKYLELRATTDDGVKIDSENVGEFTVLPRQLSIVNMKNGGKITPFLFSSLLPRACQVSSQFDREDTRQGH